MKPSRTYRNQRWGPRVETLRENLKLLMARLVRKQALRCFLPRPMLHSKSLWASLYEHTSQRARAGTHAQHR